MKKNIINFAQRLTCGLATARIGQKSAILFKGKSVFACGPTITAFLTGGAFPLSSSAMVVPGLPDKGLAVSSVHYTWHGQERVFPAKTAEGACATPNGGLNAQAKGLATAPQR